MFGQNIKKKGKYFTCRPSTVTMAHELRMGNIWVQMLILILIFILILPTHHIHIIFHKYNWYLLVPGLSLNLRTEEAGTTFGFSQFLFQTFIRMNTGDGHLDGSDEVMIDSWCQPRSQEANQGPRGGDGPVDPLIRHQ